MGRCDVPFALCTQHEGILGIRIEKAKHVINKQMRISLC